MRTLDVQSAKRNEMIDITAKVEKAVAAEGLSDGIVFLFVPHTTAGLTLNENADPSVRKDIINMLNRIVPADSGFEHSEGNSDAHVKQSMIGTELFLIVENGKLEIGTWQGVYFCEFDGPRRRHVYVKTLKT